MNSSESISKLTGHTARVARIGFHPSGKYIATTSFDQTWKLWDIASSKSVLTQPGHSRPLFALGFHPDGSLLATGGYDSVGRLWDLRTGKSIMLFRAHLKPILAMDFSNDGYRLATAGEDCSIKIWDIRASKSLYSIPGHTSSVTSVRFWKAGQDFGEPVQDGITTRDVLDSSFLVSSSYDGTVKLWTDGDFKPVRSLTSADGKIMSCDVSPSNQIIDIDGQYIATSLYDRNFKIMSNIKN